MSITPANTPRPLTQPSETQQPTALQLSTASARPYETLTDQMLMKVLMPHAKILDPYNNSAFTRHDLYRLSEEGIQPNGQPAKPDLIALAHEMRQRPELMGDLDIASGGGYENGTIKLDSVAKLAGEYSSLSDHALLQEAKLHHGEFDSTGNGYVNFGELKQAAGLERSDRHFSPEAKAIASALLKRPALLEKLDIGVGFLGLPGKQDQRYDIDNLNHMIGKASKEFNHPFKSQTD